MIKINIVPKDNKNTLQHRKKVEYNNNTNKSHNLENNTFDNILNNEIKKIINRKENTK